MFTLHITKVFSGYMVRLTVSTSRYESSQGFVVVFYDISFLYDWKMFLQKNILRTTLDRH